MLRILGRLRKPAPKVSVRVHLEGLWKRSEKDLETPSYVRSAFSKTLLFQTIRDYLRNTETDDTRWVFSHSLPCET